MRLGVNFDHPFTTEAEWNEIVADLGVETVVCALPVGATSSEVRRYKDWADRNHLPIAEVGIWVNVLDNDEQVRRHNIRQCQQALALADELNSRCCVNISGSRGQQWDGYDARNFDTATYDAIVQIVRDIIDAVKPTRTYYTLEPMPRMYPTGPEEYLRLIRDINRKAFSVHLDVANMVNSFERYHQSKKFIDECFDLLGPYIRSIHIKDVKLDNGLPLRLCETQPGLGELDLKHMLRRAQELDQDMPVLVEHLASYEEYKEAIGQVRKLVAEI